MRYKSQIPVLSCLSGHLSLRHYLRKCDSIYCFCSFYEMLMEARKQAMKPLKDSSMFYVHLIFCSSLGCKAIPLYLIIENVSCSFRMGLLLWGPLAITLRNPLPCKYQGLLPISKRHSSWRSPALCMSLKPLIVSRWTEKKNPVKYS